MSDSDSIEVAGLEAGFEEGSGEAVSEVAETAPSPEAGESGKGQPTSEPEPKPESTPAKDEGETQDFFSQANSPDEGEEGKPFPGYKKVQANFSRVEAKTAYFNFADAGGSSGDEEDICHQDPTQQLREKDFLLYEFSKKMVDSWTCRLLKENVLILCGHDPEVIDDAAEVVARQAEFKAGSERRLLQFEDHGEASEGLRFRSLLQCEIGAPTEFGRKFLLVDARFEDARTFLHSLIRGRRRGLNQARHELAEKSWHLLVICDAAALPDREDLDDIRVKVDYLEIRLKQEYPECYRQLLETLKSQRQRGLWPQDDTELFRSFETRMRRGDFKEKLESYEQRDLKDSVENSVDSLTLHRLTKPEHRLAATVHFVATFLNRLPMRDFDQLVTNLLGERREKVQEFVLLDGVTREEEKEGLPLCESWRDRQQEILEECWLIAVPPLGQSRVRGHKVRAQAPELDYEDPMLRDQLRKFFWGAGHTLFLSLFEEIKMGMLLEPGHKLVDGLVELIVDAAEAYPERHGVKWLDWLLSRLKYIEKPREEEDQAEDSEAGTEVSEASKKQVLGALEKLVRGMLRRRGPRQVVERFLNQQLERRGDLRELVWRLRRVDGFDPFHWWLKLLEPSVAGVYLAKAFEGQARAVKASQEVAALAYEDLGSYAVSGIIEMTECLEHLARWWPQKLETHHQAFQENIGLLTFKLCWATALKGGQRYFWPPANRWVEAWVEAAPEIAAEPLLDAFFHRRDGGYWDLLVTHGVKYWLKDNPLEELLLLAITEWGWRTTTSKEFTEFVEELAKRNHIPGISLHLRLHMASIVGRHLEEKGPDFLNSYIGHWLENDAFLKVPEDLVGSLLQLARWEVLSELYAFYLSDFIKRRLLHHQVRKVLPQAEKFAELLISRWMMELGSVPSECGELDVPCLVQALVLADWSMILLGAKRRPPQAEERFHELVATVDSHLDRRGRKWMRRHLGLLGSSLRSLSAEVKRQRRRAKDHRSEITQLYQRIETERSSVSQLKKRLVARRTGTHSREPRS